METGLYTMLGAVLGASISMLTLLGNETLKRAHQRRACRATVIAELRSILNVSRERGDKETVERYLESLKSGDVAKFPLIVDPKLSADFFITSLGETLGMLSEKNVTEIVSAYRRIKSLRFDALQLANADNLESDQRIMIAKRMLHMMSIAEVTIEKLCSDLQEKRR